MNGKKTVAWVVIIALVILSISAWGAYNSLVTADEQVDTQLAQIETQLQRRFDLVPNLVNSVQGMMTQEQEVFGMIAEARTQYAGAQDTSEQLAANTELTSALGRLLVIMENYPELTSSQAVQDLMTQLEGTENRISVARQRYNEDVQGYNLKVKKFPGKIYAAVFGFDPKEKFEADEGAETAPVVDLKS